MINNKQQKNRMLTKNVNIQISYLVKNMAKDSKIIDFLLAFFLGFGIFRLYKGWWLSAIIKFITGGGAGIWWLIDWVYVLIGKKHHWQNNDFK